MTQIKILSEVSIMENENSCEKELDHIEEQIRMHVLGIVREEGLYRDNLRMFIGSNALLASVFIYDILEKSTGWENVFWFILFISLVLSFVFLAIRFTILTSDDVENDVNKCMEIEKQEMDEMDEINQFVETISGDSDKIKEMFSFYRGFLIAKTMRLGVSSILTVAFIVAMSYYMKSVENVYSLMILGMIQTLVWFVNANVINMVNTIREYRKPNMYTAIKELYKVSVN